MQNILVIVVVEDVAFICLLPGQCSNRPQGAEEQVHALHAVGPQ